jgi:hypothetical protein
LALAALFGIATAGITMDKDLTHGHGDPKLLSDKTFKGNRGLLKAGTPMKVHMVPHTHDDVGWLKSPD